VFDFLVVRYKSGGEAMNALMAGQADFAISNVTVARPLVTSDKLRASRGRQRQTPGWI
jgi:tripartite-type tricarboxylate transporter receptor subunit TctC